MLGKTHFVVGITTTLSILNPTSLTKLLIAIGFSAFGAILPDIDVGTSSSHRDVIKILAVIFLLILTALIGDKFYNLGIYDYIIKSSQNFSVILAVLFFCLICIFGMLSAHRTFMHSFLSLILLCCCLNFIFFESITCFVIGFISHICLDLLNDKNVMLFYPCRFFNISFGLCKSNGFFNWLIFSICSLVMSYLLIVRLLF